MRPCVDGIEVGRIWGDMGERLQMTQRETVHHEKHENTRNRKNEMHGLKHLSHFRVFSCFLTNLYRPLSSSVSAMAPIVV